MDPRIRQNVPLAPLTTMETGGPARYFLEAVREEDVAAGVAWAREQGTSVVILGGGSNVLVADAGVDALVIQMATRGVALEAAAGATSVRVAAGEEWDALVAATVEADLAGLECLSGIPGSVGAAPVQNIGAYGQEVADTIRSVRVLDLHSLEVSELSASDCAFAYRDSIFRRNPGDFAVLEVTLRLEPAGAPTVTYPDLIREMERLGARLADVREAVLRVRRRKSMVVDLADENHRSVGSFFTNPIVPAATAEAVAERAERSGIAQRDEVPRYPAGRDTVKLSAAWLIERSGIARGTRMGRAAVSTRHTLALVNLGGATTEEVLRLASWVRETVSETFGVDLAMEPVCLGPGPPSLP